MSTNTAIDLLREVRGKPLQRKERCQKAIALATLLLQAAREGQTPKETREQEQIHGMLTHPEGKAFVTAITDQVFRCKSEARAADQFVYNLDKFGIPTYLPLMQRLALRAFKWLGRSYPEVFMPLAKQMIREETAQVILPGESALLRQHLQKRRQEGVRVNLNHLGEAILGEEEARQRFDIYVSDLNHPDIDYISIKISTIYSQLNLLGWEATLDLLAMRLRELYRTAMRGKKTKFVNLDMEEYRDLHLTVELFRRVLDEPEFQQFSAGIVLQSYLPDSFKLQQELTEWALERKKAPIKIRIVKGANLAMEQVEASLRDWEQAPYLLKSEVDENFKRMLEYGCEATHARVVHLGIGSHNLFDIAYTLVLRAEQQIEPWVGIEMLEGMADPVRRAVQAVSGDMLLYSPVATAEEFQYAVAYLVRRLDENTAPENFLSVLFGLKPGTAAWKEQAALFEKACLAESASTEPRRQQDQRTPLLPPQDAPFANEPDTDWSLPHNRLWGLEILSKQLKPATLPLTTDPSQLEQVVQTAVEAYPAWSASSFQERATLLYRVANALRKRRGKLIGSMVAETFKTIPEADTEVSEAIDFAEYYRRNLEELQTLDGVKFSSKGVVLVAPPWNFPCSIPAGGVAAALAAGNTVILKPAPEAVGVSVELVEAFWEAGVSRQVLQIISCADEPLGSALIRDPRMACVILTGATETAKLFLTLRPGLDLAAETGGKNALIVTALADRDLAVKDMIQSAFGHAGQKCSACSLAILEAEVYDDPNFRKTLRDAAASLHVGTQWDARTKVNPLIREPNPTLLKGLTTLEEGEEWLLKPELRPEHPYLWSPGIKWGVKPGSFTYQNELFGPVLGVMRADNLEHAIALANGTPYGLTSGLHSLDEREHALWIRKIQAGNCYINRGITGAIVRRQPFGGCKQSSFGRGAKAGGPNYVMQLMHATDSLTVPNYKYWWDTYFSKKHDPSQVLGEENQFFYVPQPHSVWIQAQDLQAALAVIQEIADLCHTPVDLHTADPEAFIRAIQAGKITRVRFLSNPPQKVWEALAEAGIVGYVAPVLNHGRVELLHYLREVSLSYAYHRYGYLGLR